MRHNRKFMKIELESGNVITTKPFDGIGRGDSVKIFYDFTHHRVYDIRLEGAGVDSRPDEPIEMEKPIDAPEVEAEAFSTPLAEDWEEEALGEIYLEAWEKSERVFEGIEEERKELGSLLFPVSGEGEEEEEEVLLFPVFEDWEDEE